MVLASAGNQLATATVEPAGPWTFGRTQLLTIAGFAITIAISGFRTFERWKRERIEEKRIDIAVEALSLAYEVEFVFDDIRSPLTYPREWDDMPAVLGDEEERRRRGPFYAAFKRIQRNKDFFERVWKLQPRFVAVFGCDTADVFAQVHQAWRWIEVAAEMLARRPGGTPADNGLYDRAEVRRLYK